MTGNIVYIGRYFLDKEYRSARAKRVVNQATYLRRKFDLLIITFSSNKSKLDFNRNFFIPEKNKLIYSFIIPFYWINIFIILHKRRKKGRKNYLFLENCVDFYSTFPLIFAKIMGYIIIHDVLEDFMLIQENLSLKQKLHIQAKKIIHKTAKLYVDGFIVISDRLYTKYEKLNKPIIKLYNSIEPKKTTVTAPANNNFTFFYSGTFCTKDGVIDLIKAFNIVENKFNNIKLVLVGKGEFASFEECKSLILNNHKISYLGYLSENKMFKELSKSDLCCITRINSEVEKIGFPKELAEYLSFGKPILSTSASDIPLLFTDKKNILLAEPGNPESISLVMEYAIKNQDELIQIGINGKNTCNNLFSISNIGEKLSDFVLQLS